MELRQYQQDMIQNIRKELCKGNKSVCAVLGCGGGKSIIQASIAKSATDKGSRVLFLVHRKELCNQIEDTFFDKVGVNPALCDIMMVQTASRRLDKLNEPQLIITDECHHSAAKTYTKIYNRYPDTMLLGFTATPWRMGGGLDEIYDTIVEGVSTRWLIDNNYLADYKYKSVKLVDTAGIHKKQGDYDLSELAEVMENKKIYGDTVSNYRKIADGKKTIIYCASIQASKDTIQEFKNAGYAAEHLDGNTIPLKRTEIVQKFKSGKINILSNVDLFGEGFDVPDCECVILLRPTLSLTLHIQQSMRSMRYKKGKTAIIIDHVGNVYKHGLPDDIRVWDLVANKNKSKKKEEEKTTIRECPICGMCYPPTTTVCECGYEFKVISEPKDVVDMDLKDITRDDIERIKWQKATNFEELDAYRKLKGYHFNWVFYQCIYLGLESTVPYRYTWSFQRFVRTHPTVKRKTKNNIDEIARLLGDRA